MSKRRRNTRKGKGSLRKHSSIDGVFIEQPFELSNSINGGNESVGDGCYVSTTVNGRRYYGLLVDQNSLQEASILHFQGEASSLEVNRRMVTLEKKDDRNDSIIGNDTFRGGQNSCVDEHHPKKRRKANVESEQEQAANEKDDRSVQKLRYTHGSKNEVDYGYRTLLATYASADAAAEDDLEKRDLIYTACKTGGDWVGRYYYQFESKPQNLTSREKDNFSARGLRTSMDFHTFLSNTLLPTWYPLCNLPSATSKILDILQMKKINGGTIGWKARIDEPSMKQRNSFRVGVLGAGLAGLATCLELLRLSRSATESLDLDVVLLESRGRVGGRVETDKKTFPTPVDLGASWIHGIQYNPLTDLANEAQIELIATDEDLKMLGGSMKEIDKDMDLRSSRLFDKLLDRGAKKCWKKDEYDFEERDQKAVRWYADAEKGIVPTDVPPHRFSSDSTLDSTIGEVLQTMEQNTEHRLQKVERNLLLWNVKNTEYALGANIQDLSMKYWDADEEHAFEGDHVLLKDGFQSIADHLLRQCENYNDRFRCDLNFNVSEVQYAKNSSTIPYPNREGKRSKQTIDLSDTCRVVSKDKKTEDFDFVICSLPLGVLKESSIQDQTTKVFAPSFIPPLPQSKKDAIDHVGFGLLNKIYIQFPHAFWRGEGSSSLLGSPLLSESEKNFGNASGYNPHHYMFFDVGKQLCGSNDSPAILQTLISGSEATKAEQRSDAEIIHDVLSTLRHLYSDIEIPTPEQFKVTRWGADEFSRGSYTFLPPGATDQDYNILRCPVNGNGDESMLGDSEVMRLFFAGEHTSSKFPSMAHGAYISGIRAAKDVIENISRHSGYEKDARVDRLIPVTAFRMKHPMTPLHCNLCSETGNQEHGALLAFQRGSRRVLVHSQCAEFSPEVSLREGVWKNVIKAVSRGKQLKCSACGEYGANIGCTVESCSSTYHFKCCKESWDFEKKGKSFLCNRHRQRITARHDIDEQNHVKPFCREVTVSYTSTFKNITQDEKDEVIFEHGVGSKRLIPSCVIDVNHDNGENNEAAFSHDLLFAGDRKVDINQRKGTGYRKRVRSYAPSNDDDMGRTESDSDDSIEYRGTGPSRELPMSLMEQLSVSRRETQSLSQGLIDQVKSSLYTEKDNELDSIKDTSDTNTQQAFLESNDVVETQSHQHSSTIAISLVRESAKERWGIQLVKDGEGCTVRKVPGNIEGLTVRGMNLGMLQKDDIILSITNESQKSIETLQASEFSSYEWFSEVVKIFSCSNTLHMKVLRQNV